MENEIHYLQENLKSMEEIQGLTDLQLQEADEEKERILAQLRELEKKVGKTIKHDTCVPTPGSCHPESRRSAWGLIHSGLWERCWPRGGLDPGDTRMHVIESRA